MTPNTPILDPDGHPAVVITRPVPGRALQLVVILYDTGRARLVDLAACRPIHPATVPEGEIVA
jgi:hypothetical protein